MTNEELLKEFTKHEGWKLIKERLEARLTQFDLAVHDSKTFDIYRYNNGVYKTLKYLLSLPELLIAEEENVEFETLRGKEYAREND